MTRDIPVEPGSDSDALGEVFRSPLNMQIADVLRADIVYGRIPAGVWLVQDDLCKRFGTSRIPVRDALVELTHDGLLVEVSGQRKVASLSREDLADSLELIALLHGWAARRVVELATEEELAVLTALFDRAVCAEDDVDGSHFVWKFIPVSTGLRGPLASWPCWNSFNALRRGHFQSCCRQRRSRWMR